MKKITCLVLGLVLTVPLVFGGLFGGLNLNSGLRTDPTAKAAVYDVPAPFTDKLPVAVGEGSGITMYNAQGLGTTTLFQGTGITAEGTVAGQNISFNIYGNNSAATSVVASRQEYYLIPNNSSSWINTGIIPKVESNGTETELEISFMIPEGFNPTTAHPDVAGCNAINDTAQHFGGPLLLNNRQIQFLYGAWPANSDILTAKDNIGEGFTGSDILWTIGNQYHSKLTASNTSVTASLTDGSKTYTGTATQSSIASTSFNSLFLFAQNNGSSPVNQVDVGIKEVKITQGGVLKRHFVAVPQGSTEFKSSPALSNCMYDHVSDAYFYSNAGGSFSIEEDTSDTNKMDISALSAGGLNREEVTDTDDIAAGRYTYFDGENYWAADYLEIDQEDEKVILHRYNYVQGVSLVHNIEEEFEKGDNPIADKLLATKTTNARMVLGNTSGAWMDGVIGPIVDYKIKLGSSSAGVAIDSVTEIVLNIFDLGEEIIVSKTGSFNSATWKATDSPESMGVRTVRIPNDSFFKIAAKDILFTPDKIIQQYARYNIFDGYYLQIDIEFYGDEVWEIEIPVLGEGIEIQIGGMIQTSAVIVKGHPVTITGVFDEVLYEFDEATTVSTISEAYDSYSRNKNTITFTPTNDTTLEYKIKPKEYAVQILGKTTTDKEVTLENMVISGYSGNIWYRTVPTPMTINIGTFNVKKNYVIENPMSFNDTCLYDFVGFQCNGEDVTSKNITIDALMLKGNQRIDGIFTVYAVYQKKNILNVGFGGLEINDEATNKPDVTAKSAQKFEEQIDGIGEWCWSIDEGETAVIIVTADKRYTVSTVSGYNGAQISQNYLELLVISLNRSYDITVNLKHRNVQVDFSLKVEDNEELDYFGIPQYIDGGSELNANHTIISATDPAQPLKAKDTNPNDPINKLNYRSQGLMIWNYEDNDWDSFTTEFPDGLVANDKFFKFYVNQYGRSEICLFVVQQYFVDFSTQGFTPNGTTFTNSDLGSYTIEFLGGSDKYTPLGDGKYMVDYGTEITITKTVGKYGKFVNFTGLDEFDEEKDGILSLVVKSNRYIGVSFESTKLAPWIIPTVSGGAGVVLLLVLISMYLVIRSRKLKLAKAKAEAEIRDMKRKFNISDEISKLREGKFDEIPQGKKENVGKKESK